MHRRVDYHARAPAYTAFPSRPARPTYAAWCFSHRPYGTVADEATLNKWFDEGADDSEGAANMANRKERQLKWYLGRLNAALTGTDGFAVGNALTLGDVR